MAKKLPFAGLEKFKGEQYQTSTWPKETNYKGKRVALIGTGATGVQVIPKIASSVGTLTVFQRTPNYVLPGRNYIIDDHHSEEIKKNYHQTWESAASHPFGLAMVPSGKNIQNTTDEKEIHQLLDAGWETGGFHFQFETLDDLFDNRAANDIASDYLRQKIRAIVKDPVTAEKLCPKYPFLSKRPPCGHFYYEAFNRENVKLVDISQQEIEIYENGVRTSSGDEHEFDVIIFALGFDAGTGALADMNIRGKGGVSIGEAWKQGVRTFAGVLVPNFPNMFTVCGPHIPFGNMPVVLNHEVDWIGKTIQYMEKNKLDEIDPKQTLVNDWATHLNDAFESTLFANSAKSSNAWFVGANIPGKASGPLFYFGGVPTWVSWLDKESNNSWQGMSFDPNSNTTKVGHEAGLTTETALLA